MKKWYSTVLTVLRYLRLRYSEDVICDAMYHFKTITAVVHVSCIGAL
jgi:hypothetical protein